MGDFARLRPIALAGRFIAPVAVGKKPGSGSAGNFISFTKQSPDAPAANWLFSHTRPDSRARPNRCESPHYC